MRLQELAMRSYDDSANVFESLAVDADLAAWKPEISR